MTRPHPAALPATTSREVPDPARPTAHHATHHAAHHATHHPVWTAVAVVLAPLTGLLLHWAGTWTIMTPTSREDYQLAAAWVATVVVLLGVVEVVVLSGPRTHRATWVAAALGIGLLVVVVVHDLTTAASLPSDPDSISGSLADQVARGLLLAVAAPTTWPLLGLLAVALRARSNPAPR